MKRGVVFIVVGAAVLLASASVGAGSPAGFLRGYLIGWLLCVGVSLGAMAIVMMHYLTGGAWGFPLRRFGEAAAMMLPLLALAGLPLAFGGALLFPWANALDVAGDALLRHRAVAFAPPLVLARAVIYFCLWSGWAWWLRRLSLRHDRTGDPRLLETARRISAAGLVIYFITMSLAAVDWIGSREVDWYSSTFGLVTVVGQGVAGTAFLMLMLTWTRADSLRLLATERVLHDLGNLLQTVVVLWAYISFAQFLVIWVGNTQEDIVWFHHRNQGGWRFVTMSLVVFHFGFPFLLLLFQRVKRSARGLGAVAAGVLVMRGVDVIWLVVPSAHGAEPSLLTGFDVVIPIGVLSVWFGVWTWLALRHPLAPKDGVSEREVQHGSAIATGA